MKQLDQSRFGILALSLAFSSIVLGQNALVVHDGTAGTNADILSNLTAKLVAHSFTVTPSVGVPGGSLATYQQVWDLRFSNATALTPSDITAYRTYLSGGGSLFVMGENIANFLTRDNSIVALIASAGGGSITLSTPANSETVKAPFNGPNAITNPFTFLAAAGTSSPGTYGAISTDSAGINAGIAYGPGSLSGTPAGSLLIVFDVNFLLTGADANSQALTNNLISYLAAPVTVGPFGNSAPIGTPTLGEWSMIALACLLAAGGCLTIERQRLPK